MCRGESSFPLIYLRYKLSSPMQLCLAILAVLLSVFCHLLSISSSSTSTHQHLLSADSLNIYFSRISLYLYDTTSLARELTDHWVLHAFFIKQGLTVENQLSTLTNIYTTGKHLCFSCLIRLDAWTMFAGSSRTTTCTVFTMGRWLSLPSRL